MSNTEAVMRAALEAIAGEGRDIPEMRCQEGSLRGAADDRVCGRPATIVAKCAGLGDGIYCERCARFYANPEPFDPRKHLHLLVQNLRDRASDALADAGRPVIR